MTPTVAHHLFCLIKHLCINNNLTKVCSTLFNSEIYSTSFRRSLLPARENSSRYPPFRAKAEIQVLLLLEDSRFQNRHLHRSRHRKDGLITRYAFIHGWILHVTAAGIASSLLNVTSDEPLLGTRLLLGEFFIVAILLL